METVLASWDIIPCGVKLPPEFKELASLLPDRERSRVRYLFQSTTPQLVNMLRSIIMDELPVKALVVDRTNVNIYKPSGDKTLIVEDVCDRISGMPLDQDTPMDVIFELRAQNKDEGDFKVIKASSIKQVAGKHLPRLPFNAQHRLFVLAKHKDVEITNIRVEAGCGYEHARFSLTADFNYQFRDYVEVRYLTPLGIFDYLVVRRDELLALFKFKKMDPPPELKKDFMGVYPFRILVIEDSNYRKNLDGSDLELIPFHSHILEDDIVVDLEEKGKFTLHSYKSSFTSPQEIYMDFALNGNIEPPRLLPWACEVLIRKLENIMAHKKVIEEGKITLIKIDNEYEPLAHLLTRTIYELDPSISFVGHQLEHPELRRFTLRLIHAEPLRIFQDALEGLIKTAKRLANM